MPLGHAVLQQATCQQSSQSKDLVLLRLRQACPQRWPQNFLCCGCPSDHACHEALLYDVCALRYIHLLQSYSRHGKSNTGHYTFPSFHTYAMSSHLAAVTLHPSQLMRGGLYQRMCELCAQLVLDSIKRITREQTEGGEKSGLPASSDQDSGF